MQSFNFIHVSEAMLPVTREMLLEKRIILADDGFPIYVQQAPGPLLAECSNGQGRIVYEKQHHFFRLLGLFLEAFAQSETFSVSENSQFQSAGVLFDFSRNAVFRIESVKRMLRYMAWMGLDRMLFYLEDTYEIAERPYFGYMRGRYTHDELRACDDYADSLGIEIVPVIQTLGHLRQVLKWKEDPGVADTEDILLADHPETYRLIRLMIEAVTSPLRSKRIHLGMDEAERVGLGRYLKQNGYCDRYELMSRHLAQVLGITDSMGLEAMIWSDMYFKFASTHGGYYESDTELPPEVVAAMPHSLNYVYWDYYHTDEQHYRTMLRKHKGLGQKRLFAGAVWSFVGFAVNYDKTIATSNAALAACKAEQVEDVFVTIWGDDGTETNYFAALPGMQLYAEHAYSPSVSQEKLETRFLTCTGAQRKDFLALSEVDLVPGVDRPNLGAANPSKQLLWQDVLLGQFDNCTQAYDLAAHYRDSKLEMQRLANLYTDWAFLFDTAAKLNEVLEHKAAIGLSILTAYTEGHVEQLTLIARETLPKLRGLLEQLRVSHRSQWLHVCKAFGWEVIDGRYGAVAARLETAIQRIMDYVEGRIAGIEELEAERLPFDPHAGGQYRFGCLNAFERIYSASM